MQGLRCHIKQNVILGTGDFSENIRTVLGKKEGKVLGRRKEL